MYSQIDSSPLKEVAQCDMIWFLCQEDHSEFGEENELDGGKNKNRETVMEQLQYSRQKVVLTYVHMAEEMEGSWYNWNILELHWTGLTKGLNGGGSGDERGKN